MLVSHFGGVVRYAIRCQMIRSIEISNFRCFQALKIDGCRQVNVIVGDNGSGKTALLEAIFLALGAAPDLAVRLRQQLVLDGYFAEAARRIEEALCRDLFFKNDWNQKITIELKGDGPESRALSIFRGSSQLTIPLHLVGGPGDERSSQMTFVWRDHHGTEHVRTPKITPAGLQVQGEEEDLPDFFMFAANQTTGSGENAARFSELSRAGRARSFVDMFTSEYKWIEDLNVEVLAGSPVVYATLRETGEKLPLTMVSSGINRIFSIMLALASRDNAVVLVDEIEDGIYHKHHVALWRGLLSLTRSYRGQLFVTTHNEEWLEALFNVGGDVTDIDLWRIERSKKGPVVRQFRGKQIAGAIEAGEVR